MTSMEIEDLFFQTASYLTEPICKTHEYMRRSDVVSSIARKCFLWLAAFVFAVCALFTTLPGIALRAAGTYIQSQPFTKQEGISQKEFQGRFSLLSWNLCCVPGGYPISDGGVTPWEERIKQIIQKVIETDADVNCFYEIFDRRAEWILKEALSKKGYTYFYTNIGIQAIGAPSGIMIASKFKISEPEFTRFPQDMLVERTKWAAKGIFAFTLENAARIYTTHLQHSEIPEYVPEQADEVERIRRAEEVLARKRQMDVLISKINEVRGRAIVVTGDLNMEMEEFEGNCHFVKSDHDGKTWDGDHFCALLTGKRPSGPLNLDHTLLLAGTARSIHTTLIPTGFDPNCYLPNALSDHKGVLSWIELTV